MSTPKVTIGPYVVGEKPAPFVYTFQDYAGAALPITGYAAKFIVRRSDDPAGAQTYNATVSNGAAGQVTYTWTGAEFPVPGHYLAEMWVGNGSNRFASVLIRFDVRSAVGPVPNI